MIYTDFSMDKDGFVGHMVEPEKNNTNHVVIVIMGGEKKYCIRNKSIRTVCRFWNNWDFYFSFWCRGTSKGCR